MYGSKDASFTVRQRLFFCRRRIDKSPGLLAAIEVVLGTICFAHILASIGLLWRDIDRAQLLEAVLPLGAFCFEVTLLSLIMLVLVIKDVCSRPEESLSVWQRESLGRLIRNIFLGSLLGISCLFTYESIQEPNLVLGSAVVPAVIAASIGAVKILLIKTERTWFWLGVAVLVTLQLLMLVLKTDYESSIPWYWVCFPVYILTIDALFLTFTVVSEDLSSDKSSRFLVITQGILRSTACLLVLGTVCLGAMKVEEGKSDYDAVSVLGAITYCVCYVAGVRTCGAYLLNIIWGHVEIDFLHQKYPALLARRQTV